MRCVACAGDVVEASPVPWLCQPCHRNAEEWGAGEEPAAGEVEAAAERAHFDRLERRDEIMGFYDDEPPEPEDDYR